MTATEGASQPDLKCPECKATLKRRRGPRADACEMICGGCGHQFDICDTDTLKKLTPEASAD